MLYDYSSQLDRERILARVTKDLEKGSGIFEYTNKTKRSIKQNSYLHLILGAFAMEFGLSVDYVKLHYFKLHCNKELFVVRHSDELIGDVAEIVSSRALSMEDMATAIDRFKAWAAEQGCYLPEPEQEEILRQIEHDMARCKQYGL